jgi:hypothetical protein
MPLSEYEQRVLEQMERQLTSDDPKLVNTFHGRGPRAVTRWLLTGAGTLVGLTLLVVGAATSSPVVGVLGFVLMFVSVVMAFSAPRKRGAIGVVTDNGAVRPRAGKSKGSGRPGLLARFEERWDRRRDAR